MPRLSDALLDWLWGYPLLNLGLQAGHAPRFRVHTFRVGGLPLPHVLGDMFLDFSAFEFGFAACQAPHFWV